MYGSLHFVVNLFIVTGFVLFFLQIYTELNNLYICHRLYEYEIIYYRYKF